MTAITKIQNDGYSSSMPFLKIGNLIIKPMDGVRYSCNETGDCFIPVCVEENNEFKYKMAKLHIEVDCDGTFYSCEIQESFEGNFEQVGSEYATWEEVQMLWLYNRSNSIELVPFP